MATQKIVFDVGNALSTSGMTLPEFKMDGSAVTMPSYAFDAATIEGLQFNVPCFPTYGTGNVTAVVGWGAASATSGSVVWGANIAAVSPGDNTDLNLLVFGTSATGSGTHAGTTAYRPAETSITITSLGSPTMVTGDYVVVRLFRAADNASDTMSGDAKAYQFRIEYSDT